MRQTDQRGCEVFSLEIYKTHLKFLFGSVSTVHISICMQESKLDRALPQITAEYVTNKEYQKSQ